MNVSLSGIPLGEWRDLTDDELIDLFKLIERSSSEAKPKAKAKPKTAGIKRPVVAIEKAMRKRARHQAVSALPRRDERRKDVNVCRASAYSPTRRMTLPYRVYTPAFSSTGGLFASASRSAISLSMYSFLRCWSQNWSADVRAQYGRGPATFSVRAVRARSSLLGNAGSAIRVPSVSRCI